MSSNRRCPSPRSCSRSDCVDRLVVIIRGWCLKKCQPRTAALCQVLLVCSSVACASHCSLTEVSLYGQDRMLVLWTSQSWNYITAHLDDSWYMPNRSMATANSLACCFSLTSALKFFSMNFIISTSTLSASIDQHILGTAGAQEELTAVCLHDRFRPAQRAMILLLPLHDNQTKDTKPMSTS
jgi:hypothetical protein